MDIDSKENLWELIYSQKKQPKRSQQLGDEEDEDYDDDNNNNEEDDDNEDYIDYDEDDDDQGIRHHQSQNHIPKEKMDMIRLSNKRRFRGNGIFSSKPFLSRLIKRRLPKFYVDSPEVCEIYTD